MTAASPKKPPRGGRGFILWVWGTGLALVVAYTAWWMVVAGQVQTALTGMASRGGPEVETVSVSGWPYRITARLDGVRWRSDSGLMLAARRAEISASPFRVDLWVLDATEGVTLAWPGGPERAVDPTALRASLSFDADGLRRLSVLAEGLQTRPATPEDAGWSLGRSAVHLVRDGRDAARHGLSVDLADLRLSAAPPGPGAILGARIAHLRLAGPVSQGAALARSLRAWSGAGGRLEVMAGELLWGPLRFTDARGAVSIDAQGQWNGRLAGTGALMPEGAPVPGLSAPVEAEVVDGRLQVLGLATLALPRAY